MNKSNKNNLIIDITEWFIQHIRHPFDLFYKLYKGVIILFRIIKFKVLYHKNIRFDGICFSLPDELLVKDGYIGIGNKCNISKNAHISALDNGCLLIGEKTFINNNCNIVCRKSIEIGEGCRLGPNVCLYDHNHIFNEFGVTDEYKTGQIKIGKNCWLGANVVVLPNTNIGDCCVIGASCVIKGNISSHTVLKNVNHYEMKSLQKRND